MRFFLATIAVLAASVHGVADDQVCTYALEIVQIQDASSSFNAYIDMMQRTADKLLDKLSDTFDEFKYAVSSFVDKPVPFRGVGNYGNFASVGAAPDYCYNVHTGLTDDVDAVREALKAARDGLGSGGDYPENPYEALLLAAYSDKVGWSAPNRTHSDSGRPIARVAVLVTDDVPHYAGDAAYGANVLWPWPRSYDNPDASTGGFGSRGFGDYPNVIFYGNGQSDRDAYNEMSDLFKVIDLDGTLSNAEEARLQKLIKKFGPFPYPTIEAHPGDGTADCASTEYPSLVQVADALSKHQVMPIILVAEPPTWSKDTTKKCNSVGMPATIDCLVKVYTDDLKEMGIPAVVGTITSAHAIDTIVGAIGVATDTMCIETTTPTPPTTTTEETTTEETTTEETTTEETTTEETTTEETTTEETTTEETTTEETTTEGSHDTTKDSTTPDSSTTEESTTSHQPFTPPVVPTVKPSTSNRTTTTTTTTTSSKKASVIPAIAGATGGAVAAAGVAAGVLYKKFGASLFSSGNAGDLANIQQVETPTSPVDREMMEEISMEAFR